MASAYDNWLEGDCGVDDAEEARRERVAERRDELVAERMADIEAVTDALDELIGEDYDSDRVVQGCVARFLVRAAAGEVDEAAAELFRDLRPVIKSRIYREAEKQAGSEEYDRECAADRDHGEYLAERGVAA